MIQAQVKQQANQQELWQLIISSRDNNQLENTEFYLEEYIKNAPQDLEALREYALVARNRNLKEAAISRWQQIIQIFPQEHEILFEISKDLIELKRYQEAEQNLLKFLEYNRDHLGAILWLGVLEQRRKNHETALQYFQKAIEKYPQNINAYIDMGISLGQLKRCDQAEIFFKKALKINPKSEWAIGNLVNNIYLLGGFRALINKYNTYIKEFPNNAKLSLFWAKKMLEHPYINSFGIEQAKIYLKKINQDDEEYFDALLELAKIELKMKNYQESLSYAHQAQEIKKDSEYIYSILGLIFEAMGDIEKSQQAFTKVLSSPNPSPLSLLNYFKVNCNEKIVQDIQEESKHNVIITKSNKFYNCKIDGSFGLNRKELTEPIDVFLKINRDDEMAYYSLEYWIKVFSLNPKYNIKILADIPLSKDFNFPIVPSKAGIDVKYKTLFNQTRGAKWRFATRAFLSCYEYAETNFFWNIDADDTYYDLSPRIIAEYLIEIERISSKEQIDCFSQDFYRSTTISNNRHVYDHWSFGISFQNQHAVKKLQNLTAEDFKYKPPFLFNLDFLFQYLHRIGILKCESWYIPNTVFYHTRPQSNLIDGIYSYGTNDVNKFPINLLVKRLNIHQDLSNNLVGTDISSLNDSLNSGALVLDYNNDNKSFCLLISRLEPQFYELEFKFIERLFGQLKFKVGFQKISIEECDWESTNDCQDIRIYAKQFDSPVNVLNNYWDMVIEMPVIISKRLQFFYLLKCSRNARRVLFTSHNDLIEKEFSLISKHTSSS